jgi:hypothetical protein
MELKKLSSRLGEKHDSQFFNNEFEWNFAFFS